MRAVDALAPVAQADKVAPQAASHGGGLRIELRDVGGRGTIGVSLSVGIGPDDARGGDQEADEYGSAGEPTPATRSFVLGAGRGRARELH